MLDSQAVDDVACRLQGFERSRGAVRRRRDSMVCTSILVILMFTDVEIEPVLRARTLEVPHEKISAEA